MLTVTVGLPYLLLASTSPLLQAWFARARPGVDPYRLFAVSNLASLLALIGYPLLVEPLPRQPRAGGLVVRRCLRFLPSSVRRHCPGLFPGRAIQKNSRTKTTALHRSRADYLLWLALSATGSVMLLAVTNHVTQNVAAIPLLWLAPLTLYLLTFILAFEGGGLYRVEIFWSVVLVWLARHGLAAGGHALPVRPLDPARHVPAGPVRRLHVLPRRALPRAAGGART